MNTIKQDKQLLESLINIYGKEDVLKYIDKINEETFSGTNTRPPDMEGAILKLDDLYYNLRNELEKSYKGGMPQKLTNPITIKFWNAYVAFIHNIEIIMYKFFDECDKIYKSDPVEYKNLKGYEKYDYAVPLKKLISKLKGYGHSVQDYYLKNK